LVAVTEVPAGVLLTVAEEVLVDKGETVLMAVMVRGIVSGP
jgi:hypothetical protein